MARRPAQCVGVLRSARAHHFARGGKGTIRARLDAFPGAQPDGTGAIRLVMTGTSHDGPWPAVHVTARMHVGDDLRCVSGQRGPVPPGMLQKIEIIGVVHRPHRLETERLTVDELVARATHGIE